ncbi:P1 family peptidase [Nitratireductor sp. StC3]|uniref:P1 family peptidase n=1 Tax=Nitratireductor sp. StC3 TaxID=2126741 RepID=UPI000D0E0349|nr:P1 family peptidase [Nitratireductor sp. StC3]PSM19823.1 peptidase T4 [Nitratireductor sp. StC3]
MSFTPGPRNLLTDIAGLRVGAAHDEALNSGVTAVLCDTPAVASVQVMGGAPGTRETDLLEPHNSVETVNALVLSGGSAFGLDAASGVQAWLREHDIGLQVHDQRVPIVPAAILFDLVNGGDKGWGRYPPYRELGYQAAQNAATAFELGTVGAGYGALTAGLKGGLGSASTRLADGTTVAALVAVNAVGSVTVGSTRHFWAAPFEAGSEFGGLGLPSPLPDDAGRVRLKFRDPGLAANTTIAVVATDAALTKAEAKRLAVTAHDGIARAIWPAHTPADGDLVFALATGARPAPDSVAMMELYAAGAATLARAIARGVYAARPGPRDPMPAWSTLG